MSSERSAEERQQRLLHAPESCNQRDRPRPEILSLPASFRRLAMRPHGSLLLDAGSHLIEQTQTEFPIIAKCILARGNHADRLASFQPSDFVSRPDVVFFRDSLRYSDVVFGCKLRHVQPSLTPL